MQERWNSSALAMELNISTDIISFTQMYDFAKIYIIGLKITKSIWRTIPIYICLYQTDIKNIQIFSMESMFQYVSVIVQG